MLVNFVDVFGYQIGGWENAQKSRSEQVG